MKLFLDTNILVYMVRGKKTYFVETFELDNPSNKVYTSVVCIGEMRSLALRLGWGISKKQEMERLFAIFPALDIKSNHIFDKYAQIDTFSQGKLDGYPLIGTSRTLGKNDLWIAATASVIDARLITTDADFNHLNPTFLSVNYVDTNLLKNI